MNIIFLLELVPLVWVVYERVLLRMHIFGVYSDSSLSCPDLFQNCIFHGPSNMINSSPS